MRKLFTLALTLFPWIPGLLCQPAFTGGELSVMEGQSLTVPCHYESQYAGHVKYWCRGKVRGFCTSLARTDPAIAAAGKVSISDDRVQLVFTVTMSDLKEGDSGWYLCGVEIGGAWTADVVTQTYINVIHGMSVVNSRLSGEEGSSVTVECHYSEKYRDSEKKWCRIGDWSSCLLTGSEGSYDDSSVAIRDDRSRTFTVTLKKLQMKDTGWYWCCAGQHQMHVHVIVTPRLWTTAETATSPPTQSQALAHLPPSEPITKDSWRSHRHIIESFLVCASFLFLIGLAILVRKLWKRHRQDPLLRQVQMIKARHNEYSGDVGDPQSAAVVFLNRDCEDAHMH
ncbi:uncharacterized protein ACO6RY_14474 [Pungitius sinensis]